MDMTQAPRSQEHLVWQNPMVTNNTTASAHTETISWSPPPSATEEALVAQALTSMVHQVPPATPPPAATATANHRISAVTQKEPTAEPHANAQDASPELISNTKEPTSATATFCLPVSPPLSNVSAEATDSQAEHTPTTATATTSTTTTTTKKEKPTSWDISKSGSLLPVRERTPPTRKSRAERRKLLTAPRPRHCLTHTPTLRELQSITFSDYVQKIVLGSAVPYEDDTDEEDPVDTDDSDDDEDWKTDPMPLAEGIAKVTLPDGFWPTEGQSWTRGDRTGRGPAWQAGTPLGDYRIETPIAQHVRGLAGVYEFSFVDKGPLTLAQFRDKADVYREQVVGCAYDVFEGRKTESEETKDEDSRQQNETNKASTKVDAVKDEKDEKQDSTNVKKPKNVFANEEERLEYLERFFWKRLGPTMPPAWYGADHEGTLFPEDDNATGWSLGQLDSCLHVLPKVPGVTSPYLYAGMWASVFCAHAEDMNLLSINYLHAGAPKIWYAIAPGPDAQRFESLCASSFAGTPSTKGCKEFLRHKRSLLSPKVLLKAGIKYTTAIQRPGDAIITFPAGYHFGFNSGFNVAEATNFGVPEWIPYAWRAGVCLCRPDSVRIDMNRLTSLLDEFDEVQSRWRRKRLSWKEWSAQKHAKRPGPHQPQASERKPSRMLDRNKNSKNTKRKVPLSEQQRKGEFWIEVAKPLARKAKPAAKSPTSKTPTPKMDEEPDLNKAGRGKRKRKLTAKAAKWEREQIKKKAAEDTPKQPSVVVEEIWHLARPLPRKIVSVGLRVLCLLPGIIMGYAPKNCWRAGAVDEPKEPNNKQDLDMEEDFETDRGRPRKHVTDDEEEEEEQCFTGQIVEISDDHARIHIDGLPRSEDVWLDLNDNKVFLDGGRWEEEEAQDDDKGTSLPQLHYWEEMDSKRRCV